MLSRLEEFAERLKPHFYLWVALAVAIPRVAFVAIAPNRMAYGNAPSLLALTKNIAEGRGYTDEEGNPDSYFIPAYPFLVAGCQMLTGNSLLGVKIVHIVLDIGTAIALSWLLLKTCPALAALFFTTTFALHPLLLHLGNNVDDEPLLVFFVIASFVALYRAIDLSSLWRFALAGFLLGLAILTKSTPIFLPYVATAVMFLATRRMKTNRMTHWLAYLLASITVLLPWAYRNYVVFGHFAVSTRGIGTNLWWGSDPRIFTAYGKAQRVTANEIESEMIARGMQPPTNNTVFNREHWRLQMAVQQYKDLLHQPAALIGVLFLKAARTLYATEDRPSAHLPLILLQIPTLLLAIYGTIRLWKRAETKVLAWLLVLYIGYYYGVVSAGMPMVRYFVPAIPLLLAAAAVGLVALLSPEGSKLRAEKH
ncbi:MAG TPA: glycosyltransferase family 39 protein [Verrucomicrobiae bacterium]|nr:glycosyltransferase family 39 protein [Verrucomicrobiae bacterium]